MFKFFSYVQLLVMIFVFQVKFISICNVSSSFIESKVLEVLMPLLHSFNGTLFLLCVFTMLLFIFISFMLH